MCVTTGCTARTLAERHLQRAITARSQVTALHTIQPRHTRLTVNSSPACTPVYANASVAQLSSLLAFSSRQIVFYKHAQCFPQICCVKNTKIKRHFTELCTSRARAVTNNHRYYYQWNHSDINSRWWLTTPNNGQQPSTFPGHQELGLFSNISNFQ